MKDPEYTLTVITDYFYGEYIELDGKTYFPHLKEEKVENGIRHKSCYDCVILRLRHDSPHLAELCSFVPCTKKERIDGKNVYYE